VKEPAAYKAAPAAKQSPSGQAIVSEITTVPYRAPAKEEANGAFVLWPKITVIIVVRSGYSYFVHMWLTYAKMHLLLRLPSYVFSLGTIQPVPTPYQQRARTLDFALRMYTGPLPHVWP